MNIFRLHNSPSQAAIYNQDLHVKKIILEAGSLLCNAYSEKQLLDAPKTQTGNHRKHSWYNHPLSLYTRRNINNFKWVLIHAISLCNEYEYRFNKIHFGQKLIEWCLNNKPELLDEPETIQPQCFGTLKDKCYSKDNVVQGYINYYNECKLKFVYPNRIVKASWTKRDIPYFIDLEKLNS